MPKAYPHSHVVDGELVGFSVQKLYGDTYIACFRDREGRRLKKDTQEARIGQAVVKARLLIEKVFSAKILAATATWDDVTERLKSRLATSGNRESTVAYYLKLLRLIREACPDGPASLTPEKAAAWRDKTMTTPGRRKKMPSAHYVAGAIGGLNALWQKWLVEDLKIVTENPWRNVEPPKADKLPVKYATDEMIDHFYGWIAERFGPHWSFPKLFLAVKAHTGCRLMDLCSLKSAQLQPGRLVFPANLTKGRKERSVPMPADLQAAVELFKGKEWLWENYPPGLRAALEARGFPTHQMMDEFSPQRLYFWIETLFADYRKANKDRPPLTSHMFRKRAFTMAWQEGIDARHASIAYGCNVETMLRHYVQLDEQKITDDVFARMQKPKGA